MKCIREVTFSILENLGGLVKWPETEEENRRLVQRFAQKAKPHGFPMVIGAVDGTLIKLEVPKEKGSIYKSRYQNTSLNVVAVSDCGFITDFFLLTYQYFSKKIFIHECSLPWISAR